MFTTCFGILYICIYSIYHTLAVTIYRSLVLELLSTEQSVMHEFIFYPPPPWALPLRHDTATHRFLNSLEIHEHISIKAKYLPRL